MNKCKAMAKSSEEIKEFVEQKDKSGSSVLDYCRIKGRQDIYSTIGCFCTEGKLSAAAFRIQHTRPKL